MGVQGVWRVGKEDNSGAGRRRGSGKEKKEEMVMGPLEGIRRSGGGPFRSYPRTPRGSRMT